MWGKPRPLGRNLEIHLTDGNFSLQYSQEMNLKKAFFKCSHCLVEQKASEKRHSIQYQCKMAISGQLSTETMAEIQKFRFSNFGEVWLHTQQLVSWAAQILLSLKKYNIVIVQRYLRKWTFDMFLTEWKPKCFKHCSIIILIITAFSWGKQTKHVNIWIFHPNCVSYNHQNLSNKEME